MTEFGYARSLMNYSFSFASEKDLKSIQIILKNFSLPFEDIQKHLSNFILAFSQKPISRGRSFRNLRFKWFTPFVGCFLESHRDFGLGKLLTNRVINLAIKKGVKELFLLTTTTENYYLKIKFENFDRENTSSEILGTKEFSSLCPSSAACLHKKIS